MADTETSLDGDTVDLIAWRRRKATSPVTEEIYALNPGLANYGPVLPSGVVVALPDPPNTAIEIEAPRIWS